MLAAGEAREFRGLGAGDDHFSGGEDERCGFGVADAHDEGVELFAGILGVARSLGDDVEIEPAVEVDGGDDVLEDGAGPAGVDAVDAAGLG